MGSRRKEILLCPFQHLLMFNILLELEICTLQLLQGSRQFPGQRIQAILQYTQLVRTAFLKLPFQLHIRHFFRNPTDF